ncbi:DUF3552 domain-containing protein, partial [Candidatus Peregrinibacteria bacterium]|nr:DUF3552 domain-containing protein [Candidatus Peregrinibacteria bacterium]
MDQELLNVIISIIGLSLGGAVGYLVLKPKVKASIEEYQKEYNEILNKAQLQATQFREESRAKALEIRKTIQQDEVTQKDQSKRIESLIQSKEEQIQKKETKNLEINAALNFENELMQNLQSKNKEIETQFTVKLAQKTGESLDEVKSSIMHNLEQDLELATEDRLRKHVEDLEENKVRLAKNMVASVIQRYAAPTSVEKISTTIEVARDEMKARILGKNMENLILLEELTGCDIIFNDSPNTIIISCFDLVKKHIARETIARLVKERMVNPDKVKFALAEVQKSVDKNLIRIGHDVIKKLELDHRKFPDDFAKVVGRLQFRTSYGQNILKHSYEVGYFTLMLGAELGLDMETSKIGGFFHDLGKAIDQEVGLPHDVLTKEIMEKYTFNEDEIHAAWAHHDAIPQRTAEAMLVKAGDAISAGRPGARQESLEKYIERIQAIEGISNSY